MAKSKSGGTRSYLRGRIASDVYSIGRDSAGKKQQVVRSLAEQVSNPQTTAQMRGRMIMSTVMQAVSAMSQIVDHAFDNVPNGQPSISEFIRRNYALIKADVAAHPSSNNNFGLSRYQEKGIRPGKYVVSEGKFILDENLFVGETTGGSIVNLMPASETPTIQDFLNLLFGGKQGYMTPVLVNANEFKFFRVRFSSSLPATTAVTSENLSQVLSIENPFGLSITTTITEGQIAIKFNGEYAASGIIASVEKDGDAYEHNTCVLSGNAGFEYNADVALPTYPVGTERFLNGGEL